MAVELGMRKSVAAGVVLNSRMATAVEPLGMGLTRTRK